MKVKGDPNLILINVFMVRNLMKEEEISLLKYDIFYFIQLTNKTKTFSDNKMAALKLTKSSAKRLLKGNEQQTLGYWEKKVEELENEKSNLLDIMEAYSVIKMEKIERLTKMNKKLAKELNKTKDQLETTNQEIMRLQTQEQNLFVSGEK